MRPAAIFLFRPVLGKPPRREPPASRSAGGAAVEAALFARSWFTSAKKKPPASPCEPLLHWCGDRTLTPSQMSVSVWSPHSNSTSVGRSCARSVPEQASNPKPNYKPIPAKASAAAEVARRPSAHKGRCAATLMSSWRRFLGANLASRPTLEARFARLQPSRPSGGCWRRPVLTTPLSIDAALSSAGGRHAAGKDVLVDSPSARPR